MDIISYTEKNDPEQFDHFFVSSSNAPFLIAALPEAIILSIINYHQMSTHNSDALSDIRRVRRDRYGMARMTNRFNSRMKRLNKPTPSILSPSTSFRQYPSLQSTSPNRFTNQNRTSMGRRGGKSFNQALYSSLSSQEVDMYSGQPPFSRNIGIYGNALFHNHYISQYQCENGDSSEDNDDQNDYVKTLLKERNYLKDIPIMFLVTLLIWSILSYLSIDIKVRKSSNYFGDGSVDLSSESKQKFKLFENINRDKIRTSPLWKKSKIAGTSLGSDTIHMQLLAPFSNLTLSYEKVSDETPFFLDLPLSGSSSIKEAFSKCYGLVQACELGLRQPYFNEAAIETFEVHHDDYNSTFVNVDTKSPDGIERASRLNLTATQLSEVIISPHLFSILPLFNMSHPGRMFSLFIHPIDRAVAFKHYIGEATWDERYNPRVKRMTLRAYAKSKFVEDNPITRILTAAPGKNPLRKLKLSDLLLAKHIIANKCLVGLYDDIEGSMARFSRYFEWEDHEIANGGNETLKNVEDGKKGGLPCIRSIKKDKWLAANDIKLEKNSDEYDFLAEKNHIDILLYEFIEHVYNIQGEQIFHVV